MPRSLRELAPRLKPAPLPVSPLWWTRWRHGWLVCSRRWRWFRIFTRFWLAIRTARAWRWLRRFLGPLAACPWLAPSRSGILRACPGLLLRLHLASQRVFAWSFARRVIALPPTLPHRYVALLGGVDEFLSRIAVIAARPPVTAPSVGSLRDTRGVLRLP